MYRGLKEELPGGTAIQWHLNIASDLISTDNCWHFIKMLLIKRLWIKMQWIKRLWIKMLWIKRLWI